MGTSRRLAAAARTVAEQGAAALSLRRLAAEIGVSHAAPAHHFGDKRGVLTALATEGYRLLVARVMAAPDFLEAGVAYVRFALEHPGHYQVMFRPGLVDESEPDHIAARVALRAALLAGATTLRQDSELAGDTAGRAGQLPPLALAAWSASHGFATLALDDNFTDYFGGVGEAPRGEALADLARKTLRLLGRP